MSSVTIETEIRSDNLPQEQTGGVLRLLCGTALVNEHGCAPDSITFEEPFCEDGAWKIRGTGSKE